MILDLYYRLIGTYEILVVLWYYDVLDGLCCLNNSFEL